MGRISRKQQSEATRQSLLAVARRAFAADGYAGAAIAEIAQSAEVTHGALYHHFPTKRALFAAVCEDLEQELVHRLARAGADPTGQRTPLGQGCAAFLDACEERDFQRIVLLEAPAVLGWDAWHDMDAKYGLALLTRAVEAEARTEGLELDDPESLALIVHGALNEAGHAIARAEDPHLMRVRMGIAVDTVIDALRVALRAPS